MIKYEMIKQMNEEGLKNFKQDYESAYQKYDAVKKDENKEIVKIYFAAYIKSLETLIEYFIVFIGKKILDDEKNKKEKEQVEKPTNKNFKEKYIPAYFSIDKNLNIIHKSKLMGLIDDDELKNLRKMNDLRNKDLVHEYYKTIKKYEQNFDAFHKSKKDIIEEFLKIIDKYLEKNN